MKVIIVMPAYNASKTLLMTYNSIPSGIAQEIILVDDASSDNTQEIAKRLPLRLIAHPHNVGYGGNQKTCYLEALREGADIVVMLHPDGQYDPHLLPDIIQPIKDGKADMVLGSRMLIPGGALKGGMPYYKFIANRFLTWIENLVLGFNLSEYHSGYRAYSRHFLETVPFLRNSNSFIFDQEIIFQARIKNLSISEIPITTRYFKGASSASFSASCLYGLRIFKTVLKYLLHKWRILRCSLFC